MLSPIHTRAREKTLSANFTIKNKPRIYIDRLDSMLGRTATIEKRRQNDTMSISLLQTFSLASIALKRWAHLHETTE